MPTDGDGLGYNGKDHPPCRRRADHPNPYPFNRDTQQGGLVIMVAIFVYGTLKPGETYHDRYCRPHLIQATAAQVEGRLYHLPMGYPALTLEPGWVTGTLLQLRDDTGLAAMDAFEGYDPTRSPADNEYSRQWRSVLTCGGEPLGSAWMYVMDHPRVQRYQGVWIPAGVWSHTDWPSIRPAPETTPP
ncbi:MAG: gamma-glutamylcyclotransferase family protein [Leptolyngbya sp.]|nr:gamma-glutamylcyclotransferase family protein [Leptolyngbya sp.]